MKTKIEIIPGGTYTTEEFATVIKGGFKLAKKQFLARYGEGYDLRTWSSQPGNDVVKEEDIANLNTIIGYDVAIYKELNNGVGLPTDIKIEKLNRIASWTPSNNIYTMMAMPSKTYYKGSFKLMYKSGQEPITIERRFQTSSTLSMRDIVNFM